MKKSIFSFFAALLCATSAWGATWPLAVDYPYVYLDNSSLNWDGCNVVVGHDSYSYGYLMNKIEGTNLFFKEIPSKWGDAKGIVFINATSQWGEWKNQSLWDRTNAQTRTGYQWENQYEGLDYHNTYLCTSTGKDDLTITLKSNGYSDLNSKQTIKSAYKATGSTYKDANTPAKIAITSYALNGNGSSQKQNVSLATTAKSVSVDAARTATTTLKIEAVPDGYKFDGWFKGLNDGDRLSEELTYTYYPTEETTIYARFSEDVYYLAGTLDGNDAWNADELPMAKNSDGTYSYTFTNLDAGEYEFKVTDGTWGKNWNWNNVVGEYCELSKAAKDDNIKLTLSASTTFTITFNKTNNSISFEGLTDKYTYFLMGVKGDWTDGIQMVKHPNNNNEYMLTCQPIVKETDAIKVVKYKCGEANGYCGAVEDNSVEHAFTNDDNKNIVLNTGVYDFYYKISENKVYIGASSCVVEYSIAANPTEGGTVEGAGRYKHGTSVKLTAKANPGYQFASWSDGSTTNPYIFTATKDVTLTANFETATVEITESDNSSVLTTNNGLNVNVEVQRQFIAGNLYTIALPFALNDVESVFGTGTIVYEYASLVQAGGEVVLNFNIVNSLGAGKPYLIAPTKDVNGFSIQNVILTNKPNNITFTVGKTTITMEAILSVEANAKTDGRYWLAADKYLYNSENTLPALRALFNVSTKSGMPPRARVALGENAATGLDNITNGENTTIKVIENGQLIIIRNGEKFNAQGQKL